MAIKFGGEYQFSKELDDVDANYNGGPLGVSAESESETSERHVDQPIIACIGTRSDFADTLPERFKYMLDKEKEVGRFEYVVEPNVDNVSYHASTKDKEQAGLISSGPLNYVMSPVDSKDKFSSGFYSCIALVVVGRSGETGENISMMVHTPLYDPNDDSEGTVLGEFVVALDAQLNKIKTDSVEGTVDSIIAGGLIQETYGDLDLENYTKTKDFISSRVGRYFKDLPTVVGGTKILRDLDKRYADDNRSEIEESKADPQSDEIYFDNKTRRLFLLRPEYTKER